MKSMKQIQYTSIGKRVNKEWSNGRNPEDCNFSWLAGDQCQDGPPSMSLQKWSWKIYHLHKWMLLFRKNVTQVLAERNKSLPAQSKNQSARIQIRMMFECRQIISPKGALSKLSQKQLKNWLKVLLRNLNLPLIKKVAFRIIANHAVTPGSEQLIMYVVEWQVLENLKSSKHSWTFLHPEMRSHRLVVLPPTGTAQLFCMVQLTTQF